MAVASVAGTSGSVTLPTVVAKLAAWSMVVNTEIIDDTGFGATSNFRTHIEGLLSGRGSASGFVQTGNTSQKPAITAAARGNITLTVATNCTYTGTVTITNASIGEAIDGISTIAFDYVFSGAITESAWA